ncbi:RPM1 interacting protein 13-like [Castanea sativa]|uniref:RPM1 interacting protein 13-like n=1 Tax=Castanea sativa TaxID=21020 RepID=UPI003F64A0FB
MKSITSSDESSYYEVGDISSSSIGSPIRSIFCLKEKADMKRIEEIEDCFILEFDPYEPLDVFNLSMNNNLIDGHPDGANDLFVIAERGQVALRDYPHSRHVCLNFPFHTTPHENFCKMCYCYVCDSAAPCKYWTELEPAHCHASEHVEYWKFQRNLRRAT